MTPLTTAIEALKKATEGSRRVDIIIHAALNGWTIDESATIGGPWYIKQNWHVTANATPFYTTSLDAALTLYPERPAMIPSDPHLNCLAALKARLAMEPPNS